MELNKQLGTWKDISPMLPREESVSNTIERCKEAYFSQEQLLTWWEFMWVQFRFTRKRWWAMQGLLLFLSSQILPAMDRYYRVRSIGVIGCMFVVLIIPELWRNQSTDSIHVEAACLYSLRQVYAARIALFGMVDIAILTLFAMELGMRGVTLVELGQQLLLPVTVTACICFSLFCGKSRFSEGSSMAACFAWCGVWWLTTMNERIYSKIVQPLWLILLGIAMAGLVLAVCAAVRTTNRYWEVEFV